MKCNPIEGRPFQKSLPFFLKRWSIYFIFFSFLSLCFVISIGVMNYLFGNFILKNLLNSLKDIFVVIFYVSSVMAMVIAVVSDAIVYLYPGNKERIFMLEARYDAHYAEKLLAFEEKELKEAQVYIKNYMNRLERRLDLICGGITRSAVCALIVALVSFWDEFPKVFSTEYMINIFNYFGYNLQTGIVIAFLLYIGGFLGRLTVGYRMQRHGYQLELLDLALIEKTAGSSRD